MFKEHQRTLFLYFLLHCNAFTHITGAHTRTPTHTHTHTHTHTSVYAQLGQTGSQTKM